jgi:hypothetical protein
MESPRKNSSLPAVFRCRAVLVRTPYQGDVHDCLYTQCGIPVNSLLFCRRPRSRRPVHWRCQTRGENDGHTVSGLAPLRGVEWCPHDAGAVGGESDASRRSASALCSSPASPEEQTRPRFSSGHAPPSVRKNSIANVCDEQRLARFIKGPHADRTGGGLPEASPGVLAWRWGKRGASGRQKATRLGV